MNFKTAKTSAKLAFLAQRLRSKKISKLFNQTSVRNCVVGIGIRLTARGGLNQGVAYGSEQAFMDKFGVTYKEAEGLFLAEYGKLGIGMRTTLTNTYFRNMTAERAANVVDKLAAKYARRGE